MMALSEADIALMRCPRCDGALEAGGPFLRCVRCRAIYEVLGDIPDLLPWSGGVPGPEWRRWREKLGLLMQWRRSTWDGSPTAEARQKVADDLAAEFFQFARIPDACDVLEIGCGSGELRRHLPRRRYWGLDPLLGAAAAGGAPGAVTGPAKEVFVRGVGERLPLAASSFDAVIVCETLDHALEPARVIREARRVLKDGGVLALMQSVRLAAPRPPLRARLRAAAGRLRSRLRSGRRVADDDTKMHVMGQADLAALLNAEMVVEAGMARGPVMFLRALRQDSAAAGAPERAV